MANVKIIDLPTGSPESSSFLEATQVNEQAASGRSSAKVAFNALANWIAGQGADPVEYGDLNTEDETLIGGINELHGVNGYDVYDETRTSSNKYVQGDICIHSDSLQVCTDANGAYGAWDSTKWSPTTIKALLALKQNITDNSLTTTNKQIVPAINELKANKADKGVSNSVTGTLDVAMNSNAFITYRTAQNILIVSAVFNANSAVSNNTQIAHISGVSQIGQTFVSSNGDKGTAGRFKMQNGNIINEFAMPASEYFSLTFVSFI